MVEAATLAKTPPFCARRRGRRHFMSSSLGTSRKAQVLSVLHGTAQMRPGVLVIKGGPTVRDAPQRGDDNVPSDLAAVDPARGLPVRRGCGSDRVWSEPASVSARRGQIGETRRGTLPGSELSASGAVCAEAGRALATTTSGAASVPCDRRLPPSIHAP